MTLKELLTELSCPDHSQTSPGSVFNKEVVFDTDTDGGLHLLSVYCSEDGKIHIDIGEDGE